MRLTVASIATLLLVVMAGFQNCAKPKLQDLQSNVATGSDVANNSVQYRKTAASSFDLLTIMDENNYRNIEIDLKSGKASLINFRTNSSVGDACLSSADLKPINDLLAQSDVCEPVSASHPAGQVCIQVYTYPYAALGSGAGKIMLGEKVDGCANAVDLCADKAAQLKALSQTVLSYVDKRHCN